MHIEFQFENETEITARLGGVTSAIENEIISTISLLTPELAAFVVEQKLSGQVLNKRTGKLQESIKALGVTQGENIVTGTVTQDNDIASYGIIHEFGGNIPSRTGSPMHWIGDEGESVFATFARGFTLPERSFMRSALEDFAPHVEEMILLAVARGIEQGE